MKHEIKISLLILIIFLIAQLISLKVISYYAFNFEENNQKIDKLPYGFGKDKEQSPISAIIQIVIAFTFAVFIILFLSELELDYIIKFWFFIVSSIAMAITFISFTPQFYFKEIVILIGGIILGYFKVYKKNILLHNLTELFVYPGIAVIFVAFLSQWSNTINIIVALFLLILISVYDMWAVWHSGIMQRMANYHMKKLKIFPGLLVPYLSKKQKEKIKKMKKSELKNKRFRVNIAILGGGDFFFPMIISGIFLISSGISYSIAVIIGSVIGLSILLLFSEKKRPYPAMPFISAGIIVALLANFLISL